DDFSQLSEYDQYIYRLHLTPKHSEKWRAQSVAFIGANTAKQIDELHEHANRNTYEVAFIMEVSRTKEVFLFKLPDEYRLGLNLYDITSGLEFYKNLNRSDKVIGS